MFSVFSLLCASSIIVCGEKNPLTCLSVCLCVVVRYVDATKLQAKERDANDNTAPPLPLLVGWGWGWGGSWEEGGFSRYKYNIDLLCVALRCSIACVRLYALFPLSLFDCLCWFAYHADCCLCFLYCSRCRRICVSIRSCESCHILSHGM